MFIVKKLEYKNKTFRIPLELMNKMEYIALKRGVSLNNLVVQCCEYALDNISPFYESEEKECDRT